MARRYKQARFVCGGCGQVKLVDVSPNGHVTTQRCDHCGRKMRTFQAVRDQPKAES